jgi:hypothetical protein
VHASIYQPVVAVGVFGDVRGYGQVGDEPSAVLAGLVQLVDAPVAGIQDENAVFADFEDGGDVSLGA